MFMLLLTPPLQAAPHADEQLTVLLDSGRSLQMLIRAPQHAQGRLPAVVLFGGFEGTAQILNYIQTAEPIIRASFPYPWDAPEQVGPLQIPRILADFRQAVDDTLAGIAILAAHLRQRPDVNPDQLMIVGASAGAPFATIAGHSEAIPGIVIVQGFGRIAEVIARQFDLKLVPRYGEWVRPFTAAFARAIVWWMELPEPEQHAEALQRGQQVLMVTAAADERIPAAASEALWSALTRSAALPTRLDLEGGHLRGYGDPAIDLIMQHALEWMRECDLLGPAPPALSD